MEWIFHKLETHIKTGLPFEMGKAVWEYETRFIKFGYLHPYHLYFVIVCTSNTRHQSLIAKFTPRDII